MPHQKPPPRPPPGMKFVFTLPSFKSHWTGRECAHEARRRRLLRARARTPSNGNKSKTCCTLSLHSPSTDLQREPLGALEGRQVKVSSPRRWHDWFTAHLPPFTGLSRAWLLSTPMAELVGKADEAPMQQETSEAGLHEELLETYRPVVLFDQVGGSSYGILVRRCLCGCCALWAALQSCLLVSRGVWEWEPSLVVISTDPGPRVCEG
jgi:hypothetical protein